MNIVRTPLEKAKKWEKSPDNSSCQAGKKIGVLSVKNKNNTEGKKMTDNQTSVATDLEKRRISWRLKLTLQENRTIRPGGTESRTEKKPHKKGK